MAIDQDTGISALQDAGVTSATRAAAALRRLARREDLKAAVLAQPALYAVLRSAAARYVAGETRAEALSTARQLAPRHRTTIDFMGEDTRTVHEARAATDEFLALIDSLGPVSPPDPLAQTSISLDLSHIGLAVDGTEGQNVRIAREHLEAIATAAGTAGREVIISMESSARTDAILDVHADVSSRHAHVGITVQAALHRTPYDLDRLLQRMHATGGQAGGGRIRLVKGAYAESSEHAEGRGAELDGRYESLANRLIEAAGRGQRVSIATHDPSLLTTLTKFDGRRDAAAAFPTGALQFEMLHGVTPHRLAALAESGFATQVYLVYGREWYLYLCHRLAEHPASLMDALADAVDALPHTPTEPVAGEPVMIGSSARANRQ